MLLTHKMLQLGLNKIFFRDNICMLYQAKKKKERYIPMLFQ